MDKNDSTFPVWFLDVRGSGFSAQAKSWQHRINAKTKEIFNNITTDWKEPVLIKSHIGEPRCSTRMLPEYCLSSVDYLRGMGFNRICCGDSTVIYSGERGRKENIPGSPQRYLKLAKSHGWDEDGPLKVPFIILDRPETCIKGLFEFNEEEVSLLTHPPNRFKETFVAGGFHVAGSILNHVHLTLHDMAHLACAVKGLTMGGASARGKQMMHQFYIPFINRELCLGCGICIENCPEDALIFDQEGLPYLLEAKCIGCGECVAVCSNSCIQMESKEVLDWFRGKTTLPYRMADYLVGMMENRWSRLLNIVHLYNITRSCDCIDESQEPMINDIGFLIGQNPFAIDFLARRLIIEGFQNKAVQENMTFEAFMETSEDAKFFFENDPGIAPYEYVEEKFHIPSQVELIRIDMT
ncbi:MAG: DUF362 domain-containing protein [Thermodesulfobacteriota bacterium]|nr:DUF362 domain-containing protein [Thermodesulfobacteriota bacterium]